MKDDKTAHTKEAEEKRMAEEKAKAAEAAKRAKEAEEKRLAEEKAKAAEAAKRAKEAEEKRMAEEKAKAAEAAKRAKEAEEKAKAAEAAKRAKEAEEKAKAAEAAKLVFAPTYQSTEDDIYYDAMEIYDSSPTAPQGVYLYQGLVYVIVTIDTNKEKIQYLEGTAMLRVKALLQNKFPSLPENYRLRNKLMEKEFDDDSGIYRYAVVFRLNDIKKLTE